MKREFLITADGSVTIHLTEWDEQYHSKHGAIAEAQHVFIRTGLHYFIDSYPNTKIAILEIGFGTGLNTLLTLHESQQHTINIDYTGVEAYPLELEEIDKLNYTDLLGTPKIEFVELHECIWESFVEICPNFRLRKQKQLFSEISDNESYNLIYFDAFGARVQPDLWTEEMFNIMYNSLKKNGVLVTYSAKGSARRAMEAVGFTVERLAGPPGKREMLRATK